MCFSACLTRQPKDNAGTVSVRVHTIEKLVRRDVTSRDENLSIERRAVDRPLFYAYRPFQDRTITTEEHRKEAVVQKMPGSSRRSIFERRGPSGPRRQKFDGGQASIARRRSGRDNAVLASIDG